MIAVLASGLVLASSGNALRAQELFADLTELSLEDLMDIEVTSVAKKEQRLADAAAAVYVVTQEDIVRSGVTSIPEALRLVPGLSVARIDGNKWAISSRGFNSRFANKMLVLIDGRSVYTPLFSGVYWDVQDLLLEDLDRIEVIRGPGATLWGANAVNGVINIITKSARETQRSLVTTGVGTEERGFGGIRYAGRLGERTFFRVYAKYFNRDASVHATGEPAADQWQALRAGFRTDWQVSNADLLTVQGDAYTGEAGQTLTLSGYLTPPHTRTFDDVAQVSGGNLLARWQHAFSSDSDMMLQLYFDRTRRLDPMLGEVRNVFDVEFQHRFSIWRRHEMIWGVGYRYTTDDITRSATVLFDPARRSDYLLSGFVQDDIPMFHDRFRLTIGSKFEHNAYSGFEVQPNARLLWHPGRRHALWAAVSRAVRTPSRSEEDLRIDFMAQPGEGGVVTVVSLFGKRNLRSEELIANEIGYRVRPTDRLSADIAVFYNVYDHLRTIEPETPFFESSPPPPHLVVPLRFASNMEGVTYGLETAISWNPSQRWRLRAGYTWLRAELSANTPSGQAKADKIEGDNPRHQVTLRSSLDLTSSLELDTSVYYVDRLVNQNVPSYTRLDTRVGWRIRNGVVVSVGLQNLLDDHHPEFGMSSGGWATEVQRSLYGKITWQF